VSSGASHEMAPECELHRDNPGARRRTCQTLRWLRTDSLTTGIGRIGRLGYRPKSKLANAA
jgi:hypothetical protein